MYPVYLTEEQIIIYNKILDFKTLDKQASFLFTKGGTKVETL